MTEYPKIQKVLRDCEDHPASHYVFLLEADAKRELATELRALLAERNALQAQLAAKAPGRKLREYKGVTYRDGKFCIGLGKYTDAVAFVWFHRDMFGDEDIAHLLALKSDPYEPVETVEEVLRELAIANYATRLRAAVEAEGRRDV